MKGIYSLRLLLAVTLAAFVAGCSTTPSLDKPAGTGMSLVFGHIDMDDAPSDLDWVELKRMRPISKEPYLGFWVVDGTFFRGDVPTGTYKFTQFGGHSGWKNATYTYDFPTQGKGEMDRRIDKPGLYYVGSYAYKNISTGLFEPDKFDLIPSKSPNELDLLQKIRPYANDPYWQRMIDKRIKELKK